VNEGAGQSEYEDWIDRLMTMDFNQFKAVVDDDVRSRTPAAASAALRSDALIARWRIALVAMKHAVESTRAGRTNDERLARAEDTEHDPREFLVWRGGALRFHGRIEEALAELAFLSTAHRLSEV
jgi:hypothetical protein